MVFISLTLESLHIENFIKVESITFSMTSIALAITEFPKIIERYSTKVESKQLELIVRGIDRLRQQNPAVYDERTVAKYLQDRAKTLKGLVDEYFVASITQKFPLLSDELFQLKRHLTLVSPGKNWRVVRDDTEVGEYDAKQERKERTKVKKVQVPLFAYTPLFDGKHTATLGSFRRERTDSYGDIYRTTTTIEAKLPGSIGPNLKNAYRDALSHYFGVLSEMFTNPVAGDIMYAQGNIAQPEVGAIWIPTPESLNVSVDEKLIQKRKDLDPAMILKVRGNNYLVQTWRVDDEEPFEHYLREYSIGNLRGKLDSPLKRIK